MGTSASSSGPGGGISLIPPWVGNPEGATGIGPGGEGGGPGGGGPETAPGAQPDIAPDGGSNPAPTLAPSGRFGAARKALGGFARTGSSTKLCISLAHYSRTGLGGSTRAAQRMAGTARKAGALYGVLGALGSGGPSPVELGLNPSQIAGLSSRQLADQIAHAISPADGTQDAEASRRCIKQALVELVKQEPEADLKSLTEDQIALVLELYIAEEIFQRIELDIGKVIMQKASTPAMGMARMEEMMDYVRACVGKCFRKVKTDGKVFSRKSTGHMVSQILKDTFGVFEEYLP